MVPTPDANLNVGANDLPSDVQPNAPQDWPQLMEMVRQRTEGFQHEGEVAQSIPALTSADPNAFAMAVQPVHKAAAVDPAQVPAGSAVPHVATEGQPQDVFACGETQTRFSIQSVSKVFSLALAMRRFGDALWSRVSREPSGNRFNSLVQLEWEAGIPRNPFMNAGALVVTDALLDLATDPAATLLDAVREAAGSDAIHYDEDVAASERDTAHTNAALAHFLKANGNLNHDVDTVLDFYTRHCALSMTVGELAAAFSVFARAGRNASGEILLEPLQTRRLNALMATCGFYDQAGEFAYRVGLPGKSGISGCIAAVHPGRYAVAVWSPALNPYGNSVRGMAALDAWTEALGGSIF